MDITTEKILLGTTSGDGGPEDHWVTFTTSGVRFKERSAQHIALDVNDDGEVFVAGISMGNRYNTSTEPISYQSLHHFKLNPDGTRAHYKIQAGGGVAENPYRNDGGESMSSVDIRANKTGGGYWTVTGCRPSRTSNGNGVLYNRFDSSGLGLGSTHMMRTISNSNGTNINTPLFAGGPSTDKQAATVSDNDQLDTEQVASIFSSTGSLTTQKNITQGEQDGGPSPCCWDESGNLWILTPYDPPSGSSHTEGSVIMQVYGDGSGVNTSGYIIQKGSGSNGDKTNGHQCGIRVTNDHIYVLDYSGYTYQNLGFSSSSAQYQYYLGIYKISRATGAFVWRRKIGYDWNWNTRPYSGDTQGPKFDIDDDGNCYVIVNPYKYTGSYPYQYNYFKPFICKINSSNGYADWFREIEFTTNAAGDTIAAIGDTRNGSNVLHDIKVKGECMYIAMSQYRNTFQSNGGRGYAQIGVMKAPLDGSLTKTFNFPSSNSWLQNGIFRYASNNIGFDTSNNWDVLSSFSPSHQSFNQYNRGHSIYATNQSGLGTYTNDLDA